MIRRVFNSWKVGF